jgi:hypothetical protein
MLRDVEEDVEQVRERRRVSRWAAPQPSDTAGVGSPARRGVASADGIGEAAVLWHRLLNQDSTTTPRGFASNSTVGDSEGGFDRGRGGTRWHTLRDELDRLDADAQDLHDARAESGRSDEVAGLPVMDSGGNERAGASLADALA